MSNDYKLYKDGVDSELLELELESDGTLPACTGITITEGDPDEVCFCFESPLSSPEQSHLNDILGAHIGYDLETLKQRKRDEITAHTIDMVASGFQYDSTTFDLSHMARTTWIGMYSLKHLITWPKDVGTLDGESYSLEEANVEAFMGIALGTYDAILTGERELKHAVNIATTVEELDAVIDNR